MRILRLDGADARESAWLPSAALDPEWIRQHARDADLLHIHFGTESFEPARIAACIDAAHEVGWPVVFTVHDLEHPQLLDQASYRAQLDVLVPGADAVITLTDGAAAEIRRRWRRPSVVSPHPSVLSADASTPRVLSSEHFRVGMHLKDLRPNVDGVGMVEALVSAVESVATAGVDVLAEVRMHRTVRDPASRDAVREITGRTDRVLLIEHERLDDQELVDVLSRMDACVLPYSHGTHSGWLELCWDLAVPVIAPRVGFYSAQHPDGSARSFDVEAGGESLAAAIHAVARGQDATRAGSVERARQISARGAIRAVDDATTASDHEALYRRLIAERRT
ncbi:glycosyltransferase [Leifsonia sp. YIM 134122]|uniref:Glycosyltransferase n=1 Tax=Leifsonia stereocauli TaxID=3134136 RepID=A0ABU9VZB4_9MICO